MEGEWWRVGLGRVEGLRGKDVCKETGEVGRRRGSVW